MKKHSFLTCHAYESKMAVPFLSTAGLQTGPDACRAGVGSGRTDGGSTTFFAKSCDAGLGEAGGPWVDFCRGLDCRDLRLSERISGMENLLWRRQKQFD
jgi:hypothetical protein